MKKKTKNKSTWKASKYKDVEGFCLNNINGVTIALISKQKKGWVVTFAVPELIKSKAAAKREAENILKYLGLLDE